MQQQAYPTPSTSRGHCPLSRHPGLRPRPGKPPPHGPHRPHGPCPEKPPLGPQPVSLDESQCFLALDPRQLPLHSLLISDQRTCPAKDGCPWVAPRGRGPRCPARGTLRAPPGLSWEGLCAPPGWPPGVGVGLGRGVLLPQGCPLSSSKCHRPFRPGWGAVGTLVPLPSEDTPALTQGCVPPNSHVEALATV